MEATTREIDGRQLVAGQAWANGFGMTEAIVWQSCNAAAEYDAAVDLMADFMAGREQKPGETLASARRRMLAALEGCVLRVAARDGRVTFREVDFPVNGQLFTVAGCRWCQEGQTHSHE